MKTQGYKYIVLLTFLGLVAVLLLQVIWLFNTYSLVENRIRDDCSAIVERAVEGEMAIRAENIPEGTQIVGGEMYASINPLTCFSENLTNMGHEISVANIDSIASVLLKGHNIKSDIVIYIINPKKGNILQKSKLGVLPRLGSIKSNPFPIKIDSSEAVQLVLVNPYNTFFERMGLLMIASFIMLVLVIGCISYQIKVIFYQKKIAKLRADFSFAMIHDMKTPLTAIMSCANLLRSGGMEQKIEIKEKFFSFIKSESVHLLNLTNKILSLSRLESHKALLSKKRFQLEPMLQNMTELFQVKAEKPVHFTLDLQVKEVYADEDYLGEAISNLIDNAVKYSKESVEITISTSIISKGNYTMIKVRDNGLGFSQEDKNVIFGKFERASAFNRSSKGGVAGFGLGLNYVYQVMEAHGGEVTANSVLGEFSEFMLLLPQEININTENNRYYERNNQTALG